MIGGPRDNRATNHAPDALRGKLVAATRPMPAALDVSPAELKQGPEGGFARHADSPDAARRDCIDFCRGAHAVVSWVSERIDGPFLDAVGDQLQLVANFAVGFDNIDLDACRERHVRVSNTPDAVTDGTADCAVMLLLAAARRLADNDRFCRSGEWERHGILGPSDRLGQPIGGPSYIPGQQRALLIVGGGRIGYATAVRMLGFGLRILYTARSPKPMFEGAPLYAERVDLDDGLRRADFVSLHVPLIDKPRDQGGTRHLIGERELGLMKPTAVLVNTARGPVVDEDALVRALQAGIRGEGGIFAAGLDVFEAEPRIHDGLKDLPNVVMTPHFGSGSTTSRDAMARLVAANVKAVLAGDEPLTPVV